MVWHQDSEITLKTIARSLNVGNGHVLEFSYATGYCAISSCIRILSNLSDAIKKNFMASYLTKLFFNLLILLTNIKAKESLLVLMIMFFLFWKKTLSPLRVTQTEFWKVWPPLVRETKQIKSRLYLRKYLKKSANQITVTPTFSLKNQQIKSRFHLLKCKILNKLNHGSTSLSVKILTN